ncbi:hypothetical protein Tco_1201122 [Tanacetum coccineum]
MKMRGYRSEVVAYFEKEMGENIRGYDVIIMKWKRTIRPKIAAFSAVYENVQWINENDFTSRDGESMESYYSWFYKLMNELTRNNLQVTTMQVNVQFLQQLQPEWSRFVTVVKKSKEIDTISYHILFNILKQYQNEVNDIRAERIAKSTNPLALLAAAQPYSDNYYQAPRPQRTNTTSSSIRPSASTRHKGKEIAKPVTPQSESASEEDSDPEQA